MLVIRYTQSSDVLYVHNCGTEKTSRYKGAECHPSLQELMAKKGFRKKELL